MKAIKVEILIVNHDDLSEQDIADVIENVRYPNHCISPHVMKIQSAEIGEWDDDHPLNHGDTQRQYYEQLFPQE